MKTCLIANKMPVVHRAANMEEVSDLENIKEIAEIKDALTIISLAAERFLDGLKFAKDRNNSEKIIEQVKRIDKLLPKINRDVRIN